MDDLNTYSYKKMKNIFSRNGLFIFNVYAGNTGIKPNQDIYFPHIVKKKLKSGNISDYLN